VCGVIVFVFGMCVCVFVETFVIVWCFLGTGLCALCV